MMEQIRTELDRQVLLNVVEHMPTVHEISTETAINRLTAAGYTAVYGPHEDMDLSDGQVAICDPDNEWTIPTDFRRDPKKLWLGSTAMSTITRREVLLEFNLEKPVRVEWSYSYHLEDNRLCIIYTPMLRIGNTYHHTYSSHPLIAIVYPDGISTQIHDVILQPRE